MNEMSLSSLYRRLTSARARPDVDATELVDALKTNTTPGREAVAETLAVSPPHADLARMLRELQPESEVFAGKLNERRHVAHPARQREFRPAAGARRMHAPHLRWVGGIAACFALVLGLWSWHGDEMRTGGNLAASTLSPPSNDRIFTTQDRIFTSSVETHHRKTRGSDELFRANFSSGG